VKHVSSLLRTQQTRKLENNIYQILLSLSQGCVHKKGQLEALKKAIFAMEQECLTN
jgi:hypothetical protein